MTHSAENLHRWLKDLGERYGGRTIALAIEASRGAVIHALLAYPWLTLYPITPITRARYRRAFTPAGAKDDLPDAKLLLELGRLHTDKLRPWAAPDPATVKLAGLGEARRKRVDQRTQVGLRWERLLKTYDPQALELAGDLKTEAAGAFLERWPDRIRRQAAPTATIKRFYYAHPGRSPELIQERLALLAQAVALTTDAARVSVAILPLRGLLAQLEVFHEPVPLFTPEIQKVFVEHPDQDLFRDLPGAGKPLAPRLGAAFGPRRPEYPAPASLQKYAGVAPVPENSGSQLWPHWRWGAPHFLRPTFVEWAGQTGRYSEWARVYYERRIQQGKKHAGIIRALACQWIRVLWTCWQKRHPYDEARYRKQRMHRKSPNAMPAKS